MTNINGKYTDICAVCGEPVAGYADPRSSATVPAPELGEEVRCLLCALGLTEGADLLVKSELTELPE